MSELSVIQNVTKVETDPYPYVCVEGALPDRFYKELENTFPEQLITSTSPHDGGICYRYKMKECAEIEQPPSIWQDFFAYHTSPEYFRSCAELFATSIVDHYSEEFYESLFEYTDALHTVQISGGEPFLVQKHFYLLERLVEDDLAKGIDIFYITNGNYNFEKLIPVLEKLENFHNVYISFSIDDIWERNAYIRNRKLNHNEDIEADFTDELGDKWVSYTVYHHNASKYLEKYPDQKELPDFFVESDQIDWTKRVEVQSALQENIDHCISSTINLPKETKSEVVSELYMKGWEMGLKGITVYVDGSRTGVLVTGSSESEEVFAQSEAPKRPEALECDIHRMTVYGEKWTIFVGKLDGKPYEIMGGLSHYIEIPKKHTSGRLNKISRKTGSRYDLVFGEDEEETIIRDVAKVFDNPNQEILTRMVSLSLRHGAGVSFVVEQLKKDKTSDMFSFNKCLARTLKKYIVDGTKASSERCEACESKNMVYEDGCARCLDCGHAACG